MKFVNDDSVSHDVQSDSHPAHSTCVGFNSGIGRIGPGQSHEILINNVCSLAQFRGYHDETRLDAPRFQGQVV